MSPLLNIQLIFIFSSSESERPRGMAFGRSLFCMHFVSLSLTFMAIKFMLLLQTRVPASEGFTNIPNLDSFQTQVCSSFEEVYSCYRVYMQCNHVRNIMSQSEMYANWMPKLATSPPECVDKCVAVRFSQSFDFQKRTRFLSWVK